MNLCEDIGKCIHFCVEKEECLMETNLRGKTIMKVVSILLVIGAAISIIMGLLGLIGSGVIGAAGGSAGMVVGGVLILYFIVVLIFAILQLVAAISGIKNCNNPEMAGRLMIFGIVLIVMAALNLIIGTVTSGFQVSYIFSFLLPILYTVAANMNKQPVQQ